MSAAIIRLGKISSINYELGRARVLYEDRDNSVTSELPFLAWQFNMPKINDLVVVACFSNGTVSGVILGAIYHLANKPFNGSSGLFRQEMSNTKNRAVIEYNEKTNKMFIKAPHIELEEYGQGNESLINIKQIKDAFIEIENIKRENLNLQETVKRLSERLKELEA